MKLFRERSEEGDFKNNSWFQSFLMYGLWTPESAGGLKAPGAGIGPRAQTLLQALGSLRTLVWLLEYKDASIHVREWEIAFLFFLLQQLKSHIFISL